MIGILNIIS